MSAVKMRRPSPARAAARFKGCQDLWSPMRQHRDPEGSKMTPPTLALPGRSPGATGASAFPPCAAPRRASAPVHGARSDPRATLARIRARLTLDHLGEREVTIAYEVHGDLMRPKTPATTAGTATRGAPAVLEDPAAPTLVLGGISAGRHLGPASFDSGPGWWPGLVGHGAALDPARRPLIGIDYIGGTDESNRLIRPVTTHDQARAIAAVLDHLGIARASFVGASYGGMVALAFAELFPDRIGQLVILCAAHRTHPMATAVRSVQRAVVGLGVDSGDTARGLSLARALAMTTYRSTQEFEERFSPFALSAGTPNGDPARFPVEDYLQARGADFVRRFDTERYLALSESIDLHGTRPGSLPEHALLVSFDTDILVPPWLMDELAARDSGAKPGRSAARHVTIPSLYGHDAFLKETAAVSALLREEVAR
ncbi:MAG: homoserine O-succinyltransferase [Gemmatimonadetes bacterium]|nr:homoserine O-succinyltransferase [Gemmatimonadota bacterium]